MADRKTFRRYLIVLCLLLLSLALVQVQAQSTGDTLAEKSATDCVTLCPLPGNGHARPAHFSAQGLDGRPPAQSLLPTLYVPVTLRVIGEPTVPGG